MNTIEQIGIIRRVDSLGRVVLPAELRERLAIREGDPLEVYLWGDYILLKKEKARET